MGHGLIDRVMKSLYYIGDDYGVLYGALRWGALDDWLRQNVVPPAVVTRAANGAIIWSSGSHHVLGGGIGQHEVLYPDGTLANLCLLCTRSCGGERGQCMPDMIAVEVVGKSMHSVFRNEAEFDTIFEAPPKRVKCSVFRSGEGGQLRLFLPDSAVRETVTAVCDCYFRHCDDEVGTGTAEYIASCEPAREVRRLLASHPAMQWYAVRADKLLPDYVAVANLTLAVAGAVARHIAHVIDGGEIPKPGALSLVPLLATPVELLQEEDEDEESKTPPGSLPVVFDVFMATDWASSLVWPDAISDTGCCYFAAVLALLACDQHFCQMLAADKSPRRERVERFLEALYLLYHGVSEDNIDILASLVRVDDAV